MVSHPLQKRHSSPLDRNIPSPSELIQRARDLAPVLEERALACEELGKALPETIQDFHDLGFFKIGQPIKYGGYELNYDVLCEVIMEIAHGCASSAWNLAVLGEHNYTLTNSSSEILEELWGKDSGILISTGNDPGAVLEPVDGGFIFNALINYSSGCDYASWWMSRGTIKGTSQQCGVLIPKINATIVEDSWNVAGLVGSGSKDVRFENVFVPSKYVRPQPFGPEWGGLEADVRNPATYRLSQQSTKPFTLVSVSVGIAGGVIQAFIDEMRKRISRFGERLIDLQSIQLRIAESSAEYEAARRIVLGDIRESINILKEKEDIPADMHHRNRRDMGYCPRLCQAAVDRLFYAAGAGALSLDSNLQRQFRDVHAAGAQVFLSWDINATNYGRARLGVELGNAQPQI